MTVKKTNDKDNEHVLIVWNIFKMNTMKDYHKLNLKWNILLLADVFGKFRNSSIKIYRLYPSHYMSALALSWDAILNMKIDLKLVLDANMYLLFEKGMRGGISYISKRYSKASNKCLKSYDLKEETKHYILIRNLLLWLYYV